MFRKNLHHHCDKSYTMRLWIAITHPDTAALFIVAAMSTSPLLYYTFLRFFPVFCFVNWPTTKPSRRWTRLTKVKRKGGGYPAERNVWCKRAKQVSPKVSAASSTIWVRCYEAKKKRFWWRRWRWYRNNFQICYIRRQKLIVCSQNAIF